MGYECSLPVFTNSYQQPNETNQNYIHRMIQSYDRLSAEAKITEEAAVDIIKQHFLPEVKNKLQVLEVKKFGELEDKIRLSDNFHAKPQIQVPIPEEVLNAGFKGLACEKQEGQESTMAIMQKQIQMLIEKFDKFSTEPRTPGTFFANPDSDKVCHYCGKIGHVQRDCFQRERDYGRQRDSSRGRSWDRGFQGRERSLDRNQVYGHFDRNAYRDRGRSLGRSDYQRGRSPGYNRDSRGRSPYNGNYGGNNRGRSPESGQGRNRPPTPYRDRDESPPRHSIRWRDSAKDFDSKYLSGNGQRRIP